MKNGLVQESTSLYLITGEVLANDHRVAPSGGRDLHVANRSAGL